MIKFITENTVGSFSNKIEKGRIYVQDLFAVFIYSIKFMCSIKIYVQYNSEINMFPKKLYLKNFYTAHK